MLATPDNSASNDHSKAFDDKFIAPALRLKIDRSGISIDFLNLESYQISFDRSEAPRTAGKGIDASRMIHEVYERRFHKPFDPLNETQLEVLRFCGVVTDFIGDWQDLFQKKTC